MKEKIRGRIFSFIRVPFFLLFFILLSLGVCAREPITQSNLAVDSSVDRPLNRPIGKCGDDHSAHYQAITDIQGPGAQSPLIGQWVITEGVVTQVLQGNKTDKQYRGFWLQQADTLAATRSGTSRGIFVYHTKHRVQPGQTLRILGRVAEFQGLTEVKQIQKIIHCGNASSLPKVSPLILPVTSLLELERLEGMRVQIAQTLVVSDLYGAGYGLGNYGQFAISSQLHFQPTELMTVKEILQNPLILSKKEKDYLLVDDGTSRLYPSHIPFPTLQGFSAKQSLKIGDQVKQLQGVLHAYGEHYIVIPDFNNPMGQGVLIESLVPQSLPLVDKKANVIVASMNLGNYFNGNPSSFSQRNVGFPTARGAKSYTAFKLQRQKIVSALTKINADIIALMEIENDGYGEHSAIADLTRTLNTPLPKKLHYHYLIPPRPKLGEDRISVGILYRKLRVETVKEATILDSKNSNNLFNDHLNRPSLLQSFKVNGQLFLLAVNHFKSKGKPCTGDKSINLQGNCNQVRKNAAQALVTLIEQHLGEARDRAVLIVGDLNSYRQEDPLLELYQAGYRNLQKEGQFTYSFQGYLGNLDHALGNQALLPRVRSIDAWHINSIEDVLLDYHSEANGHAYPSIDNYAEPDERRSSDHDPIVIGLEF